MKKKNAGFSYNFQRIFLLNEMKKQKERENEEKKT
jgi:hypothetical protein